jgi:amino acid transporter
MANVNRFFVAFSFAVAPGFLDHLDVLTSLISFGALTGFMILHVTVVHHFGIRKRSRALFKHFVSPVIGFVILGYVVYSMGSASWALGASWFAAGVVYYVVLTQVLRRSTRLTL